MNHIVGITGYARHGKNSVADIISHELKCCDLHNMVEQRGFADPLREMALAIDPWVQLEEMVRPGDYLLNRYSYVLDSVGYEKAKEISEVRRFLQVLGTEAVRGVLGENIWVNVLDDRIKQSTAGYTLVTDVRFANETDYIVANGTLISVTRLNDDDSEYDNGMSNDHPSESYVATAKQRADYHLTASNLDDLQDATLKVLDELF